MSELCKQIKLEQPDIDDQTADAASMLPEEACALVAEFHDDTGESIVPDDAIAGNKHSHKQVFLLYSLNCEVFITLIYVCAVNKELIHISNKILGCIILLLPFIIFLALLQKSAKFLHALY